MQTDKDDEKYEGADESEYHFSDDDGSFDTLEPEVTETAPEEPAVHAEEKKPLGFKGFNAQTKRMAISAAVFVGLVFIVYKMVAPSTQTLPTRITPPVTAASTEKPMQQMSQSQPVTAENNQQPPAATPPVSVPVQPTVAQNTPPAMVPTSMQPAAPQSQPVLQSAIAPNTNAMVPGQMPSAQNQPVTQPMAMPTSQPQPTAPGVAMNMNGQPTTPQQVQQTQEANAGLPGMPAVIEVQSTPPPTNYAAGQMPQSVMPLSPTDQKMADIQASNEKLINELQSDYSQKINEFETQNKNLTDQVQTLNTKISSLESQLTQLVQALSQKALSQQQAAPQQQPKQNVESEAKEVQPAEHLAYNVQAIIPGRAWLRGDNGDTVTVAEGDSVKNLGRVTKIDPYDGIVEINTGRKVVSLSYGTSG